MYSMEKVGKSRILERDSYWQKNPELNIISVMAVTFIRQLETVVEIGLRLKPNNHNKV